MHKPVYSLSLCLILFLFSSGSFSPAYAFDSITKASQSVITPFDSDERLYLMDEQGNIFLANQNMQEENSQEDQEWNISVDKRQWRNNSYPSGQSQLSFSTDEKSKKKEQHYSLSVSSQTETYQKNQQSIPESSPSETSPKTPAATLSKHEGETPQGKTSQTSLKIFTDLFSS